MTLEQAFFVQALAAYIQGKPDIRVPGGWESLDWPQLLQYARTQNLAEICRTADILVAAVGKVNVVTADMVKPGAVVIDVAMNRNQAGKLCGDVDYPAVKEIVSAITPVPGGVGPMTRAMLMKNTLLAAQKHQA